MAGFFLRWLNKHQRSVSSGIPPGVISYLPSRWTRPDHAPTASYKVDGCRPGDRAYRFGRLGGRIAVLGVML
jgi:hypothetical protein